MNKSAITHRSPDVGKAFDAARNIMDLLNRKTAIDNEASDGEQIVCDYCFFQNILTTRGTFV